jgi:hypothetical protein
MIMNQGKVISTFNDQLHSLGFETFFFFCSFLFSAQIMTSRRRFLIQKAMITTTRENWIVASITTDLVFRAFLYFPI